ncbi:MAG: recombination mediator RecR [Bacteroidota bacterium]
MTYASKLIEEAVEALSALPGIGKKTALRLALFLLKSNEAQTEQLATSLQKLRREIQYCQQCHNVADQELCSICTNPHKDPSVICVVENIQDIIAVEITGQYRGLYHVLGGIISPMEGIGPESLTIDTLLHRVENLTPREIIFALSPTIEGDTTLFYIAKKLKPYPVRITTIARGVAIGSQLEYTDEVTLARSIAARTPYQ